jgi:hypothetical protein
MSEHAGNPRLVLATGGHAVSGTPEAAGKMREFAIDGDRTTIGSAATQDIQLDGLRAEHGIIRRASAGDEFLFEPVVPGDDCRLDGVPILEPAGIHTGDRIDVGPWILVFVRDEEHDHIRPDGGREGGEYVGGGISDAGGHQSEPD